MPLIFYDGFDDCTSPNTDLPLKGWFSVSASSSTTVPGTGSTRSIVPTGLAKSFTSTTDIIVGMYIYFSSNGIVNFLEFYHGGSRLAGFNIITGSNPGAMGAYTDGGSVVQVGDTRATVAYGAEWNLFNYWEFRVKFTGSGTGIMQARKNGILVLNITGLTFANGCDSINLLGGGVAVNALDDFYLVDNSDATGFLGPLVCTYLQPSTDQSPNQWTPSTGTNHSVLVSGVTSDGDSTYLSDATSSDRELFTLSDLTITPVSILAVRQFTIARADSAGLSIKEDLVSGATTTTSSSTAVANSGSYQGFLPNGIKLTDPNTSAAWTVSGVNALQAGFRVA